MKKASKKMKKYLIHKNSHGQFSKEITTTGTSMCTWYHVIIVEEKDKQGDYAVQDKSS